MFHNKYNPQTIKPPNPNIPTTLSDTSNRPAAEVAVTRGDTGLVDKKLTDGVVLLPSVVIAPFGSDIENVKVELPTSKIVATGTVKFMVVNEIATVAEELDVTVEAVSCVIERLDVVEVCPTTATTRNTILRRTVKNDMIECSENN